MVNTKIRLLYYLHPKMEKYYNSQQKQDLELNGSHTELLIAKFRLKLKKVGKPTRSFAAAAAAKLLQSRLTL